jgi:hypothetical protein
MAAPDYYIECFWLEFKDKIIKCVNQQDIIKYIIDLSIELNKLKSERKYSNIQNKIQIIITELSIKIMKTNNLYHLELFWNSIKKWNRLCSTIIFDGFKLDDKLLTLESILSLLIDLRCSNLELSEKIKKCFTNNYIDSESLVKISIENNKPRLIKYIDNIQEIIKKIYNLEIPKNLSSEKIVYRVKKCIV